MKAEFELQAYLDGELPPAEALRVAERIAACIFEQGLARVPRTNDVGALIRARAYRPVYPE